jgi:hypothetical protein
MITRESLSEEAVSWMVRRLVDSHWCWDLACALQKPWAIEAVEALDLAREVYREWEATLDADTWDGLLADVTEEDIAAVLGRVLGRRVRAFRDAIRAGATSPPR